MGTFDSWSASVKRELISLGLSSVDAAFAIDENEGWFLEQYQAGAGAGITADEWVTHHHVEGD